MKDNLLLKNAEQLAVDIETFKKHRNLCGRIQRMLTTSCITIEKKIEQK